LPILHSEPPANDAKSRRNPANRGPELTINESEELSFLARSVMVILVVLIVGGVLWYGVTFEIIARIWHQLVERPSGPMAFRFILQPLMAAIAAILHGRMDARTGRSPYFWTVVSNRRESISLLREGLNATARIILLGVVMDVIYQIIVLKTFYPVEAVIVAVLLGFVPYLAFRGIVTRILLMRHRGNSPRQVC
jgi:hypothetical protein